MQRFKNILCIVTGEATDPTVVPRAVALAEQNQAQLTIAAEVPERSHLPALPGQRALGQQLERALIEEADARLDRLVAPHAARVAIATTQLTGTPFLAIIRKVLRDGHDLVIKAPEDPSWSDRLLGSDDMHLMRKCPCPVWLHRPVGDAGYGRILAAIDCEVTDERPDRGTLVRGPLNRLVFELASAMALAEGAALHLVHAWEAVGESVLRSAVSPLPADRIADYVSEMMRQNQAAADDFMLEMEQALGREHLDFLAPDTHLVKGSARDVIPEAADKIGADLVVMGTVARTGVPGLLIGNTAETVLSRLRCSVLAVKPPGFKSPVA